MNNSNSDCKVNSPHVPSNSVEDIELSISSASASKGHLDSLTAAASAIEGDNNERKSKMNLN